MSSPVTANKIRNDLASLDRQIIAASQAAVDAAEAAAVEHQEPELVAAAELAQIEIEGLQRRRSVLQAALDPIAKRDAERASRLANEDRRLARTRLEKDLAKLREAAWNYEIHVAKLAGMYGLFQEAAAKVREHFSQAELLANGESLAKGYSSYRLRDLAAIEIYRETEGQGPGARRDDVPMDFRDRPKAIPTLTAAIDQLGAFALKVFDGAEPAAKPKPYIVPTAPAGALNASYTQHGQML